jgi:PhzF family phenazine biosynthesis protein
VRIRIIDAFTDRAGTGNPAGVVLFDTAAWPPDEWMRLVAAELSLSEVAFAHPQRARTGADWALRWFTPVVEDDLCGHATLATAHTIAADAAARGEVLRTVRFATRSGVLPVTIEAAGAITLDFPAAPITETSTPEGLSSALGAAPVEVYGTGALRDLLVVLPGEATVRALAPDLTALADICRAGDVRGVTVTARADGFGGAGWEDRADGAERGYDFVSRFFAPADGIPEDPVTGSAHTALAPYWSARLGRDALTGLQASARTGLVRAAVRGDRVDITGTAVTVLDGTLQNLAP